MSQQTVHAIDPQHLADLRKRAASRLTGAGAAASGVDALAVLHELAASPETASDALTLLHELQVHQVELDLQAQELRESRVELESALRRQIELYDFQPIGCFTIDAGFVLHELNRTGAQMLGIARDDAYGLPLDAFFQADSARRFRSTLSNLNAGAGRAACLLTLSPKDAPERSVLATIGADPAGKLYLVNLANAGDEEER
jgi:PAS domain-containing protein